MREIREQSHMHRTFGKSSHAIGYRVYADYVVHPFGVVNPVRWRRSGEERVFFFFFFL